MYVTMYLFLFFVVLFMTIFTFTAEKQINRVRLGIAAFVLNCVFTVGWVSEVVGLIWHEGMDFFRHFGVPAIVISLVFSALCTVGTARGFASARRAPRKKLNVYPDMEPWERGMVAAGLTPEAAIFCPGGGKNGVFARIFSLLLAKLTYGC